LESPKDGKIYCGGIDLAKTEDFSVVTIFDAVKRHMVFFDRFQRITWPEQKQRIIKAIKVYNNASMVLDSTGIGDAIYDDLIQDGIAVVPFKFTNDSKKNLVQRLQVALEQRLISFPDIPELITELTEFEYSLTPGGNVTYSAPEGKNDDCVISLGLSVWGMRYDIYEKEIERPKIDYEWAQSQSFDPFRNDEKKVEEFAGGVEA
jgi:hypothetical protein